MRRRPLLVTLVGLAAVAVPSAGPHASASAHHNVTIVLEQRAWTDGSSWYGVVTRLQKDGYSVDVPLNPLRGPNFDTAYFDSYLKTVSGPIMLVGQSYGGFVDWVEAPPLKCVDH